MPFASAALLDFELADADAADAVEGGDVAVVDAGLAPAAPPAFSSLPLPAAAVAAADSMGFTAHKTHSLTKRKRKRNGSGATSEGE